MMHQLFALGALLVGGCGSAYTTDEPEAGGGASSQGEPGASGGAESPTGTGGELVGSGGSPETGGAPWGSGGAENPTGTGGALLPPTDPTTCPDFVCGSATLEGSPVYCVNVLPNASTAGHLTDKATDEQPGSCIATLDGVPEDISDGIGAGRLVIWGCSSFWLNCY